MDFLNAYSPPYIDYNPGGGESMTEQGGYVPLEVMIREMQEAGERLYASRTGQYDFDDPADVPDDVEPDPTRRMDMTEVAALNYEADQRLREYRAERARNRAMRPVDPPAEASEKSDV